MGAAQASTTFDPLWRVLDEQVSSGRFPGYVAAVRIGGQTELRAGGRKAAGPQGAPMTEDTLFRLASVTKPIGGALTLRLIQDGLLALDDPVARWLPGLAQPRVLVTPDGPLDETVEARRPITVRHLLTLTCGWGAVLEETPLRQMMIDRELYPGPLPLPMSGDDYVARLAEVPLAFQPGDGWLYDTGIDVLGALLTRAAATPLSGLLVKHVTEPLGMTSTSFGTSQVDRLATAYRPGPDGRLGVLDPPGGAFSHPPAFEELGSGLVSTAGDVLRFFTAMADGGGPVLSGDSLALLTRDALDDGQRREALPIVGPGASWGMGTSVDLTPAEPWMARGRWGWTGGAGTSAFVDPARDTVAVLLTQREMTGPRDVPGDFWTAVAQAAAV